MRYRKKTGTISATGSTGLQSGLQDLRNPKPLGLKAPYLHNHTNFQGDKIAHAAILYNHNSPILRTQKGTALLIAIIFIPLLLILSLAFIGPITSSYRAAAADQKRILARAVAENLYEQAMFETKDLPIGANAEGELKPTDIGYGEAQGRWWVFGRPQTDKEHLIDGKYYIPSVGTGDAGGDYCSSANPVYDKTTLGQALDNVAIDKTQIGYENNNYTADKWPCNWTKIKEGESAAIPLYSTDDNEKVLNPVDLGLQNFELRIRAACNPDAANRNDAYTGQICDDDERYVLAGDEPNPDETVIVLWEISGEEVDSSGNPTGRDVVLRPIRFIVFKDSNIYITNINSYTTTSKNLNQNSLPTDQDGCLLTLVSTGSIGKHLLNQDACPSSANKINKPVLKFMVIHSLRDGTGNRMPHLEYQFRTDAPGTGQPPISNSSKIVKVEVMVDGGYSQTLERTIALPKPITGFVIQQ